MLLLPALLLAQLAAAAGTGKSVSNGPTARAAIAAPSALAPSAVALPLAPASSATQAALDRAAVEQVREAFAAAAPEIGETMNEDLKASFDRIWGLIDVRGLEPSGSVTSAERLERGDEHARTLLKLGFRRAPGREHKLLWPRGGMTEIFARYERRMAELVRTGVVTENDLIRPALPFTRREDAPPWTDYVGFVRPGIDPWPNAGEWEPSTGDEYLIRDWRRAIANGAMPVSLKPIFIHDLGHLTEFYARPELMKLTRERMRRRLAKDAEKDSPGDQSRDAVLGEFLTLPDVERAQRIRALTPEWFAPGNTTREERAMSLAAQTPAALLRRASALVEASKTLLLRNGGGARDHYSYERFHADHHLVSRVLRRLRPSAPRPDFYPEGHWTAGRIFHYSMESLHVASRELTVIMDLMLRPETMRTWGSSGYLERMTRHLFDPAGAAVTRAQLRGLLAERVAFVESIYFHAVRLKVTPELVHRELLGGPPPKGSATREFFELFPPLSGYHDVLQN